MSQENLWKQQHLHQLRAVACLITAHSGLFSYHPPSGLHQVDGCLLFSCKICILLLEWQFHTMRDMGQISVDSGCHRLGWWPVRARDTGPGAGMWPQLSMDALQCHPGTCRTLLQMLMGLRPPQKPGMSLSAFLPIFFSFKAFKPNCSDLKRQQDPELVESLDWEGVELHLDCGSTAWAWAGAPISHTAPVGLCDTVVGPLQVVPSTAPHIVHTALVSHCCFYYRSS